MKKILLTIIMPFLAMQSAYAQSIYFESGFADKDPNSNSLRVSNDSASSLWIIPVGSYNTGNSSYYRAVTTTDGVTTSRTAIYGISAGSGATASYLQLFNAAKASVTLGTTSPDVVVSVPANSRVSYNSTQGINFGTGLTVASTTDRQNSTVAVSDVVLEYKT